MRRFRNILRFTTSLILMFVLVFVQLSMFVKLRVLNGDFYRDVLAKDNYFILMREQIDYGFKNLSMITSIPQEIFVNSVSDLSIRNLCYSNIDNAESYMKFYNKYEETKIDTTLVSQNLESYLKKYAVENKITVNDALKKQMSEVTEETCNIVDNHALLFNIKAVEKYSQFQSFRKILYIVYRALPLAIVAVVILAVLQLFLNRRRPRRTFLWVGSSFISSSVIILLPALLALYFKIAYKFSVDTTYLKEALKNITLGYINYFVITGVLSLVIGFVCLMSYVYLSNVAHEKRVSLAK